MSPLAIKGILVTALATLPSVSWSHVPVYICSRVRPCIASADTPADSAASAFSIALDESDHPVRIFTVNGISSTDVTSLTI